MQFDWNDLLLIVRLILDICLVWTIIYAFIRIIRNNNRTIQIVKGILVLFLVKLTAMILNLQAANYMLNYFLNWGVVLVLIILQPEIRGMLEKIGKTNVLYSSGIPEARMAHMIDELVNAVDNMSKSKTGALITLQMGQSMQDYEETGIPMNSQVSSELLETIFQYGTPMHDGAVIIEGDEIAAAAAYYPSTSKDLPSKYGARHRAAVGISEVTDSITLVVSEETGTISVAMKGALTPYNSQALHRFLTNKLIPIADDAQTFIPNMINTVRNYSSSIARSNKSANKSQQKSGVKDERIKPIEVVDMRNSGSGQNGSSEPSSSPADQPQENPSQSADQRSGSADFIEGEFTEKSSKDQPSERKTGKAGEKKKPERTGSLHKEEKTPEQINPALKMKQNTSAKKKDPASKQDPSGSNKEERITKSDSSLKTDLTDSSDNRPGQKPADSLEKQKPADNMPKQETAQTLKKDLPDAFRASNARQSLLQNHGDPAEKKEDSVLNEENPAKSGVIGK